MKYRKKPVEVEVWQFNGEDRMDWPQPFAYANELKAVLHHTEPRVHAIEIGTLEGKMIAVVGDWIIQGVKGEYYPCKPNIFELTYEKVAP